MSGRASLGAGWRAADEHQQSPREPRRTISRWAGPDEHRRGDVVGCGGMKHCQLSQGISRLTPISGPTTTIC